MKLILNILLFIWQLPQIIIGFFVRLFTGATKNGDYYNWKSNTGLSLSSYFMFVYANASETVKLHEYGHSIQSKILGWFYLIIIGLPSLIWACIWKKTGKSYYWFYTESWANILGGVEV